MNAFRTYLCEKNQETSSENINKSLLLFAICVSILVS